MIKKSSGTSNNTMTKWYFIVTWTCLLAVFASLYHLSGETERLRRITDGYSAYIEAWSEVPTIAITKTTDNGSGLHSLFADTAPSSFPDSTISIIRPAITTPDVLSSSKTIETTTTPNTIPYAEDSSLAPTPSSSMLEPFGLLSIEHIFTSTWTEHQAALRHAMQKLTHSAQFIWNICQRLYYYPLDPP